MYFDNFRGFNLPFSCIFKICIYMILFAVRETCLVLFPYNAQNEDELSLQDGQIINIVSR